MKVTLEPAQIEPVGMPVIVTLGVKFGVEVIVTTLEFALGQPVVVKTALKEVVTVIPFTI